MAYKLEFAVKVNLSVLINRDGEYLSVKISEKMDHNESGYAREDAIEDRTGNSTEEDIMKQKEESVAGEQDFSGENVKNKYVNTDMEIKEDKYIEALEQLGSKDSIDNTVN